MQHFISHQLTCAAMQRLYQSGHGQKTAGWCSVLLPFAEILQKFSGAARNENPWMGGKQHVVKAARLPQFALLWEQFHQQDLSENKFSSGNEGAAGTERKPENIFRLLKLHYLDLASLWYLGLLQESSRVVRPAEPVLKVNPANRRGTTPA